MSVFAPDTDLRLVKCPLTYGDGHQLDFATAAAQATYFSGLTGKAYTDFSYQRKDHIIRIPDLAENIYPYNYVMYRNKSSAKWFYAFITKIEFINQNCTHVHIRTDVFQTWMFDYTLYNSRVIREHTETDYAYEHTLPEPIDVGDVKEIYRRRATPYDLNAMTDTQFDANYRIVMCLSGAWGQTELVANMYGGAPKTLYYYGFARSQVSAAVHSIVSGLGADAIISVYVVPIGALNWSEVTGGYDGVSYYLPYDKAAQTVSVTIPISSPIPGLGNFKNKKCLCYPYHFYKLWSADGTSIELKPEDIVDVRSSGGNVLTLQSTFNGAVNPSLTIVPRYYRYNNYGEQGNTGASYGYCATFSNFPQIAVKSSAYENYLALNQNSLAMNKIEIGANVLGGLIGLTRNQTTIAPWSEEPGGDGISRSGVSGMLDIGNARGVVSSAISGAMSALAIAAQMRDLERVPDHVKGTPQGNSLFLAGGAGVFLSEMAVKPEYLAMVDDFFTMYGYYVNDMKTPQFNSRPNHNYIETQGCNLSGDMPQDDADELKAMFDGGLTVWHNPATFGNYSVNNAPT